MKLQLEPTRFIETIEGQPCRRWEGVTDTGVSAHVWIRCLSPQTHDPDALAVFDRELKALPPVAQQLVAFDFRFVS